MGTGLKFSILEYDSIRFITGNGNAGVVKIEDINEQGLSSIAAGEGWALTLEVENPNGVSYNQWGTCIVRGVCEHTLVFFDGVKNNMYLCSIYNDYNV